MLCTDDEFEIREGEKKSRQEGVVVACRGVPNWENVPMSRVGFVKDLRCTFF